MITTHQFRSRFRISGSAPAPPAAPVASFSSSDTTIFAGDTVTFTNTSTGSAITSHLWEVDDGGGYETFSTSEDAEYEFTSAGSYSIRLTETNDGGSDQSDVTTITVEEVPSESDALLNVEYTNIYEGEDLLVYNDSTVANDEEWSWEYREEPGGSWTEFSTSENPGTLSGLREGTYSLRLTVTDDMDEDFVSTRLNLVTVLPEIDDGWYPEDDTATATDHDNIPNLVADALVTVWADPGSQNLSDLTLGDGDILGIPYGSTVIVDEESTVRLTGVGVAGTLKFSRSVDTELLVQHLYVFAGGILDRGTRYDPIDSHTSTITILDEPLDTGTADALGPDPEQFGNGVLNYGRFREHGKEMQRTFVRLAAEALAGHTSLTLSQSCPDWAVGDIIVLPESRMYSLSGGTTFGNLSHRWEARTITSNSGVTLGLSSALSYDHPAARDFGGATIAVSVIHGEPLIPHVGNVTRTVRWRSENGAGVRGHILHTARADVDVRYVEAKETGRTTNGWLKNTLLLETIDEATNESPISIRGSYAVSTTESKYLWVGQEIYISGGTGNTAMNGLWTLGSSSHEGYVSLVGSTGNGTYTGGGKITRIGEQQKGRYGLAHIHHCHGPIRGQSSGRAFTIIGCSYYDMFPVAGSVGNDAIARAKWPLTIHGSSFGHVKDCVIHHAGGAGVMFEDGSEYENLIEHNFVMNAIGEFSQRHGTADNQPESVGRSGIGFMQIGCLNRLINNVAAGSACIIAGIVGGTGFYWYLPAGYDYTVVTPDNVGDDVHEDGGTTRNLHQGPILECRGNEFYGAGAAWGTMWQIGSESGNPIPDTVESVIEDSVCWHVSEEFFFGYPAGTITFDGFEGVGYWGYPEYNPVGITWGDYHCYNVTIRNFSLRNCSSGIASSAIGGTLLIENGYIESYSYGVALTTPASPGSGTHTPSANTEIRNVTHAQLGSNVAWAKIGAYYTLAYGSINIRKPNTCYVYDFDGTPGDDFQLFAYEQASDYVTPQTGGNVQFGSPESGLTNAENYVKYHNDGSLKVPTGSLSDPEGMCVFGVIAPDGAVDRVAEKILGLTVEL